MEFSRNCQGILIKFSQNYPKLHRTTLYTYVVQSKVEVLIAKIVDVRDSLRVATVCCVKINAQEKNPKFFHIHA